SMNCPLTCSFCYYSNHTPHKRISFPALLDDIELVCRLGQTHFYFMDPNFVLSESRYEQLCLLQERLEVPFTYYCQASPNFLDDAALERLRGSGCCGLVLGVENEALIRAKGTLAQAEDVVARIKDFGMLPMLFFIVDGKHDVLSLIQRFWGCPFR